MHKKKVYLLPIKMFFYGLFSESLGMYANNAYIVYQNQIMRNRRKEKKKTRYYNWQRPFVSAM